MEHSRRRRALPRTRRPPEQQLAPDFVAGSGAPPAKVAREWGAPSEQRLGTAAEQRLVQAASDLRLGGSFIPFSGRPPRAADIEYLGPSDQQSAVARSPALTGVRASHPTVRRALRPRCRGRVALGTTSFRIPGSTR